MSFEQGFNGGLAGFQYIQDQQDRLRAQKLQDEALGQQRQAYADKQQRQAQDDEFAKVGRISALIASAPTPEARAMIYGSAKGSLANFASQHGLPLPEVWDDSHLPEVQQMAAMFGQSSGADAYKPMNVSPGGEIVDPRTGRVIHANNNFAPQRPFLDQDRGMVVSPYGGTQQYAAPMPQPQRAPEKTYTPLSADEVAGLGLPAGTVAQRGSDGQINVVSKPDPQTRLSATQLRQANVAKAKLIDLQAIKNQLGSVRERYNALKGTFSAGGFGQGYLPTEEGKRFDKAVALLASGIRKMTRTPGEGSMSDWEGKLAILGNPNRTDYESVTADNLDQLDTLLNTLTQGYEAMLQDNSGPPVQETPTNQPRRIRNPQTGEVRELRNGQWVKVNG